MTNKAGSSSGCLPEILVVVDRQVSCILLAALTTGGLQEDVVDEVLMVAFRVEPIACPAFQVEQVLGHVLVQIVFCRGLLFIVPVSLFIDLYGLAASEPFAYLLHTQHIAPVVRHPGIVRGVYPEPFAKGRRVDGVDDVAVGNVCLWHAGDDARRDAHRQVALVQHRSQPTAVQSAAAVLAGFGIVDGVVSACRVAVLSVVAYFVVDIGQDTFDGSHFVASTTTLSSRKYSRTRTRLGSSACA